MNNLQESQGAPALLWNSREAAKALSISERTLWGLTQSGEIPCVRIGRSVRYDPADLRAWIESRKEASAATREPEIDF